MFNNNIKLDGTTRISVCLARFVSIIIMSIIITVVTNIIINNDSNTLNIYDGIWYDDNNIL